LFPKILLKLHAHPKFFVNQHLMLDYVHVINFLLLVITIIISLC